MKVAELGFHIGKSAITVMARILRDEVDKPILLPENIYSVEFDVWTQDGTTLLYPDSGLETLSKTSVLLGSLITNDDRWDLDSVGYNFRHTIPASAMTSQKVRAQYKFRPYTTGSGSGDSDLDFWMLGNLELKLPFASS